jgi:hypothetical protein
VSARRARLGGVQAHPPTDDEPSSPTMVRHHAMGAAARAFVGSAIIAAIGSCSAVVSFDEYGVDGARGAAPQKYAVRGEARGLEGEDAKVRLGKTALDVRDGEFSFGAMLDDGERYEVTLESQPPHHTCALRNEVGRIAASDGRDVQLSCVSTDNRLALLIVSGVELTPAFDPGETSYRGVLHASGKARVVTVVARALHTGASLTVNDKPTESGAESEAIMLQDGMNLIVIAVTALDGQKSHYSIFVTVM